MGGRLRALCIPPFHPCKEADMGIARKMREMNEKSSTIRKMFEEGLRMKAQFSLDRKSVV